MSTTAISPRVALNALNTLVENVSPDHANWATINGHMVIVHRIELPHPKPIFQCWLDGKPITMRELAHHFDIDTTGY